jgi:hypothetical protein
MTSIVTRAAIGMVLIAGVAATAQAEYRCNPPATHRDRRACEAAQEGPQALRRYLLQMSWHGHSMQMQDYVSPALAQRWEELARDEARKQRESVRQTVGVEPAVGG